MDKTIEKKFFNAFKINGVVSKCIEYLRAVHDLPETKDTKRDESWEFYIKQVYPEEILKYTNAFNFKVLELNDSPLMNEIKANFNSCLYEVERREYLFSLLAPFGEQGCNIAGVFTPTEQNEWTLYVRDQFRRMIGKGAWVEENSVGECLSFYYNAMIVFANRLYAFLLSCGIDMMKLQELMGIYLMENPNNNLVNKALGSDNLRQRYIDALPKEPQPEQANSGQTTDAQSLNPEPQQMELKDLLPEKLKADEAVEVFQNAIDAQLITNSPEGLKWNDTKQLLAYFATKVSDKFNLTTKLDKDGNKTTDWKTFETLFKQKELKGAKQNWMRLNTKFEPTGFGKVDALF